MSKKYLIDRAKYERLRSYCEQYPIWVEEYDELQEGHYFCETHRMERSRAFSDPTCNRGILMAERSYKIELVDKTLAEVTSDSEIQNFLRLAIVNHISYRHMNCRMGLRISKDDFFEAYRKFFWLLSKKKLYY